MEDGTGVDAGTVKRWLETAAASLREQRDYLTQLDAAIGDADHGTNMDRGFTAVVEKLGALEAPPGKLLTTAGSTLVSTVGGASGPLWGTALRRAGRRLGEAEDFDGLELAAALDAALEGVVELGAAREGDKTMVDALAPAVRTLRAELESGAELPSCGVPLPPSVSESLRCPSAEERSLFPPLPPWWLSVSAAQSDWSAASCLDSPAEC